MDITVVVPLFNVEESAREMITACEAVEGNKFGLYMLDKELAARTYTQASPLATANA
jgi:ferritin